MTKTIVVLGASRGIGKACVELFSEDKNHTVIGLSRNIEPLKELALKENVVCASVDLTASNFKSELSEVLKPYENIDILVNNAGKLVSKPFLDLSKTDIASCYDTNVIGIMLACQVLVPKMEEKGGHILNISSIGGVQGSVKFPGLSAYSTSKAALVSFTELFSEEYKESKIKMNCLALGAVQTEMLEEAFPGYQAPLSANEMAEYIVDFSLNGSKYYNGKILPVSLSTP
ncbi:MAG: SDR family NAD(P)-dependent oxidoreductase [Lishizhenia sp.]